MGCGGDTCIQSLSNYLITLPMEHRPIALSTVPYSKMGLAKAELQGNKIGIRGAIKQVGSQSTRVQYKVRFLQVLDKGGWVTGGWKNNRPKWGRRPFGHH